MKAIKLGLISLIIAFLGACSTNSTETSASFDDSVKDANATIDQAKAADYEWRDSRKILKKATKLNAEGKTDEAMKLVAKAKQQATIAIAQAKEQSDVAGPRL